MPYQVVHAIAGRLRIRVPRLVADQEFAVRLNQFVAALAFVTEVRINSAAHSLVVSYAASGISVTTAQTELLACIQRAESTALSLLVDSSDDSSEFDPVEPESEPQLNHWQDLTVPAISLSVALLAAPLEIPALLAGGAIAAAAMPWVMRATDSLVTHRHPNIDLLDSLWMGLQALQGQYVAPALKTTLVEVRRSLRGEVVQQRQVSYQEGSVWVERKGENCCLPALSVQVGDRVIVNPGDRIPVDGQILEGSALLDISGLTELATPIVCSRGDRVYASGQVLEGRLSILAERTGENTRIALVANLIKAAPIHDTEIGHRQSEFVKSAIIPTIGLSGVIFALTGSLGAAISLYQLDFGSGIQISILTTLFSALTYAARQGIYIRSARILELLALVDTIVFDSSSLLMSTRQGYKLRPESVCTLTELQAQNIQIYWVIDADSDYAPTINVDSVAAQLGMEPQQVFVSQHQQAELVRGLQQQGKTVAFVSGTNSSVDCPADVTVSLASDVAITDAMADVHLLDYDLQGLVRAIAIGKRAMEVVHQNTAIIVIPNLLVQIGGGIFLGLNPVVNVITNNSSAFIAEFLHSARPLFEPDHRAPQNTCNISALRQADALRQNELAKRLGITSQALTHKRSKPDFADWSQLSDPERKAWIYEPKSRWFYAISTQARNLTQPVEKNGRVRAESTAYPV
jgi:cation transport ATPase